MRYEKLFLYSVNVKYFRHWYYCLKHWFHLCINFLQDAQTSYGFDRTAVEGEQNKYISKDINSGRFDLPQNQIISYSLEDDADLPKDTIIEYSLEDEYGVEGSGSAKVTHFNKDSVQKLPQESYAYANDYYGAASKIGRKLETDYYGNKSVLHF